MEKQILELVESNDIKAVEKSRLFKLRFMFLLKSDQTIMSFHIHSFIHSYIHYGIIFAKNLMENVSNQKYS